MTNEEIQKTMEFIVERQAQIERNFHQIHEERLRGYPRLTRFEESFQLLVRLARKHGLVG